MARHGGDIYNNRVELDFSVNVNPLGMPGSVELALANSIADATAYPDISCSELRQGIAELGGVAADSVVIGNGASELFMAIAHALRPRRVIIPVPSFYGYEYVCDAIAAEVECLNILGDNGYRAILDRLDDSVDMIFIANPNNPTGKLLDSDYIEDLLGRCEELGITVVLDQCFIGLCQQGVSAVKSTLKYKRLIVVDAFTKVYAIPGVRLGYMVCGDIETVRRIQAQLPEWNVSGPAQAAGLACLGEFNYVAAGRRLIEEERIYLESELRSLGLEVYSGSCNYILFYSSAELYAELLDRGILIRDCSNYRGLDKGYYRVAVRCHEDNEALILAVKEVLGAS